MTAEFYLFNVDHGQCAALRLPNGRWCIFDLGRTNAFSPIEWIVENEAARAGQCLAALLQLRVRFRFLKATVSHLHGDHLADYPTLLRFAPGVLRSVEPDQAYLQDCYATCADKNARRFVQDFAQLYAALTPASGVVDYAGALISEQSLPVAVARKIGGNANARVNNASIVSRIEVYGTTILLCGDLMKEAWDFVLWDGGAMGDSWRQHVADVDILVAPHHGHRSGYSTELLNLAKPAVVLVSVQSRDPNVDSRYSQAPVRGVKIRGTTYRYISTRQKGYVKVEIQPPNLAAGQFKGGYVLDFWR